MTLDEFKAMVFGFIAGLLVMCLSLGTYFYAKRVPEIREAFCTEAVKAGAAVRVVDQETGEVSIEWKGK